MSAGSNYDHSKALVVELGSGYTKAGFAYDDLPRLEFPTIIGE